MAKSLSLVAASKQYAGRLNSGLTGFTGLTQITLEGWIKRSATGVAHSFLTRYTSVGSHVSFSSKVSDTDKLLFAASDDGNFAPNNGHSGLWVGTNNVSSGVWHHIAMVFDFASQQTTFHLDGGSLAGGSSETVNNSWTAMSGSSLNNSTSPLYLGTINCPNLTEVPTEPFDGLMDKLRIWNYARTAAQIAANYKTDVDPASTGLIAYFEGDDNLNDSTSNANHLTAASGSGAAPTYSTTIPFSTTSYTQALRISGTGTSNIAQDMRITGGGSSFRVQDLRITGSVDTNTTRDLRITGTNPSANRTQDLRIRGEDYANVTRALRISGTGADNARTEFFLDTTKIDSSANVTFGVNTPTKDAGNPVFPVSGSITDTWDHDKSYVRVLTSTDWPAESRYRMWYSSYNGTDGYICYAYSSDGQNWIKPNVGRITYAGNTNNNLIFGAKYYGSDTVYNPNGSADQKYIMILGEHNPGGVYAEGGFIYKAANPEGPYTLIKDLSLSSGFANSIVLKPDGKWIVYDQRNLPRQMGAWTSDTTDLTGSWTDQGVILGSGSAEDQKYASNVEIIGELYYHYVMKYVTSTERITLQLYISRDGLTLTQKDAAMVPLGTAGAWDDEMITKGGGLVRVGNDWFLHFAGAEENHAHAYPRNGRIGIARIKFGRIGKATFTSGGVLTSTSLGVDLGTKLYINGNFSGGKKLEMELTDLANTPLTGYSQADFDDMTTDDVNHVASWGGVTNLPVVPFKIVFHSDDGVLYEYSTTSQPAADAFSSDNRSLRIHGSQSDNTTREIRVSGVGNDAVSRDMKVIGIYAMTRDMRVTGSIYRTKYQSNKVTYREKYPVS